MHGNGLKTNSSRVGEYLKQTKKYIYSQRILHTINYKRNFFII
jgi:hypothetical protein